MQLQPDQAINDLAAERHLLWHAIARTHSVDDLGIRRLLKRFDGLIVGPNAKSSMAAMALHEQAYLRAYQQKTSIAMSLFDSSLAAGLSSLAVSISRAHALYICGEIDMAKEVILHAHIAGAEPAALSGVADACVHTGLLRMARDLYIRSGKQAGEVSSSVLIAAEIMDESGSTDEQVSKRLAIAAAVVKSMSTHPLLAFDLFAMQGEGILYRFAVKGEIERLMEIDSAIDDALSGFNEGVDEIFSIGVAPFEFGYQIMASDGYHVHLL